MELDEVLKHFKSQAALAEALDVEPMTVSHWKTRGIPKGRQYEIKELLKKKPKKHKKYSIGWNWE